MEILTRKDLKPENCIVPGCNHEHDEMFIICTVHPGEETTTRYNRATGVLEIICKQCSIDIDEYRPIMKLQIKD